MRANTYPAKGTNMKIAAGYNIGEALLKALGMGEVKNVTAISINVDGPDVVNVGITKFVTVDEFNQALKEFTPCRLVPKDVAELPDIVGIGNPHFDAALGRLYAELQPDTARRHCDGTVDLGSKCGDCGQVASVTNSLPATPGLLRSWPERHGGGSGG